MGKLQINPTEIKRIVSRLGERSQELNDSTIRANDSLTELENIIITEGITDTLELLRSAIENNARAVNDLLDRIGPFMSAQMDAYVEDTGTASTNIANTQSILDQIK